MLPSWMVRDLGLLWTITFFILLPAGCGTWRFSIYFRQSKDELQASMLEDSDRRVKDSKTFLVSNAAHLSEEYGFISDGSGPIDIALTVVTVSRNRHQANGYKPQYLTQVVGQLLQLLEQRRHDFNRKVKVTICNVDPDADSYWEAQELNKIVEVVNRFDKLSLPLIDIVEKEKQDYVFCLNASLSYNPSYVLLIEDDALPKDDFFSALSCILDKYVESRIEGGELIKNEEDIAYVKLFHPEKTLGYFGGDLLAVPELVCTGFTFGTLLCVIYCKLLYRIPKIALVAKIWTLFILYVMLICIAVGRPHMLELRRLLGCHGYTFREAPECCTPAMLFPARGARRVVSLLAPVQCRLLFGKDLALEQLRRQHKLNAYLVLPNLVSHIGMFSSLSQNLVDPFIV